MSVVFMAADNSGGVRAESIIVFRWGGGRSKAREEPAALTVASLANT
jgi:hypothetical protein